MITEFDEQATSKEIALANLKYAILHHESIGVIDGYELAAVGSGATSEEIKLARVDALVSRAVRYPIT